MSCGIYKIINKLNKKIYIGSAICIEKRWRNHTSTLKNKKHGNSLLQNAWNKYGEDNFIFEVIEEVQDKNLLLEREQYWLDYYKSYEREFGYNICISTKNSLGVKRSAEFKKKLSQSHVGKKHSEETKNKISKFHKGKKRTDETRKKISESKIGKYIGIDNPMYGKCHNNETRKKISEANKNKNISFETRKKISESLSGDKNPNYGKHHSEETKRKMRIANSNEKSGKSKLTWEQVREIREKYATGNYTMAQLSEEYDMKYTGINYIINNRRWVEEKF